MATYTENTDIAASTDTAISIHIGDAVAGTLSFEDADWIKVSLKAGKAYQFDMKGTFSNWPGIEIRDSYGAVLDRDDNNRDDHTASTVTFVAQQSGTYYVSAGMQFGGTAEYKLTSKSVMPPKFASYDTIAKQLTTKYWVDHDHTTPAHWDIKAGKTLTVNLGAMTGDGRQLAKWALEAWTDVSGIKLKYVSGSAQIKIDAKGPDPHSNFLSDNGFMTEAHVHVPTSWIKQNGSGYNSYTLATFIHEIGHALGLGHPGDYNNTAYDSDILFENDSKQLSIMSYLNVDDNPWVSASKAPAVTPQIVDIIAIQKLYGTTAVHAGNTVFNLKSFFPGSEARMTLVDTGGIDTLNASWSAESQKLDLNTDRFSSVGGGLNNLSLSRGTVIENAIGGKGNDFLYGNAGNNVLEGRSGDDILVGGKGADRLIGGAGSDALTGGSGKDTFVFNTAIWASNSDTITDFSVKDDMIELAHTVFKSFHETGSILQAAFNIGNTATSADSFLTYNAANGDLSYDADGTGSNEATVIAHLRTNLALTYLDFSIA